MADKQTRRGRPRKEATGWHDLPAPPLVPPPLPNYAINPLPPLRTADAHLAPPHNQQALAVAVPPKVPPRRERSELTSDAECNAYRQLRRKAQWSVQESKRAPRDRSGRARPSRERASAEHKRKMDEVAERAALAASRVAMMAVPVAQRIDSLRSGSRAMTMADVD